MIFLHKNIYYQTLLIYFIFGVKFVMYNWIMDYQPIQFYIVKIFTWNVTQIRTDKNLPFIKLIKTNYQSNITKHAIQTRTQ